MLVSNKDDPKLTWRDDKDNKNSNINEGKTMTKKRYDNTGQKKKNKKIER